MSRFPERITKQVEIGCYTSCPCTLHELGTMINDAVETMQKINQDPDSLSFRFVPKSSSDDRVWLEDKIVAYYNQTETDEQYQRRQEQEKERDLRFFNELKRIYNW